MPEGIPKTFTVYEIATGAFGSIKSDCIPKLKEGEAIYEGEWDPRKWKMDVATGTPVPLPDPTQAQLLEEWRRAMVISRPQLAANLLKAKYLNKREAVGLASGRETPAIVTRAIARLPVDLQDDAELLLIGGVEIRRMDPVVIALAQEGGLSDAALDALFGTPPAAPTSQRKGKG